MKAKLLLPFLVLAGLLAARGQGSLVGELTIQKAITFSSYAPTPTTGKLYNSGRALYWGGSAVLTGSNSITIAGTSTALGGSITLDGITGLSTVGLGKHTGANTLGIATSSDHVAPGAITGSGLTVPASPQLLGRTTAGSGNVELISAGSGLNLSASNLAISDGTLWQSSLIEGFRNGANSPELFTLSTGINEFDLLYLAPYYYFAYDDKTQTVFRHATTVDGLASAGNDATIAVRYPTILFDGSTWHAWGWDSGTNSTKHYTAGAFSGPWSYADSMPTNLADIHVRKSPVDGLYYAGYKSLASSPYRVGMLRAAYPAGPWTDLGYTFPAGYDPGFAFGEEADPAEFWFSQRMYLLFAAWDGTAQRVAIVELDQSNNCQAIGSATTLASPLEVWQQRNSSAKIFNPVFLARADRPGQQRIFYAQNPGASTTAGWGYIERSRTKPAKPWDPIDLLSLDCATGRDAASGIQSTAHDGAASAAGGLNVPSGGGAFGWLADGSLSGDFTATVTFCPTALPSAGNYALLLRASTTNSGTTPLIGIWIKGTGSVLYAEVRDNANVSPLLLTGTTALVAGKVYTATLRRLGGAVALYLNGSSEATGTESLALTTLTEWAIGNQKGGSQAAAQPFVGVIYAARVAAAACTLADLVPIAPTILTYGAHRKRGQVLSI